MEEKHSFDPIWDHIYNEGRHLVRYPWDSVVVFVNRYAPKARPRKDVRILEIACGPGNNVWFLAREGFAAAGLDASNSAIEYARQRLADEKLEADLRMGDFTALPWPDASFDLAIDRGGIVCTGKSSGRKAVDEIHRVLKPGGRFLFNPFSTRHTSYTASEPGPDGIRINLTAGNIRGVGQVAFYDRADVDAALSNGWKVLSLDHLEIAEQFPPPSTLHAEWRIVAEKLP